MYVVFLAYFQNVRGPPSIHPLFTFSGGVHRNLTKCLSLWPKLGPKPPKAHLWCPLHAAHLRHNIFTLSKGSLVTCSSWYLTKRPRRAPRQL